MAEQDLKQVMLDAITDADSLERFINGSDSETVLTRLSAEYPTLQKAIKELFENGGIAGRFKTLVELQASPLVDGSYALVADDTNDKNGVYIKESGSWVKSKYDVSSMVEEAISGYNRPIITSSPATNINYNSSSGALEFSNEVLVITSNERKKLTTPKSLVFDAVGVYRLEYNKKLNDVRVVRESAFVESDWATSAIIYRSSNFVQIDGILSYSVDGVSNIKTLYDKDFLGVLYVFSYGGVHIKTTTGKIEFLLNRIVYKGYSFTTPAQSIDLPTSNGLYRLEYNRQEQLYSLHNSSSPINTNNIIVGRLQVGDGKYEMFEVNRYLVDGKEPSIANDGQRTREAKLLSTDAINIDINTKTNQIAFAPYKIWVNFDYTSVLMPASTVNITDTYLGWYTLYYTPSTKKIDAVAANKPLPLGVYVVGYYHHWLKIMDGIPLYTVNGKAAGYEDMARAEYYVPYYDFSVFYKPESELPDIKYLWDDYFGDVDATYGLYDALEAAHPSYIKSTVLATNDAGRQIKQYRFREPDAPVYHDYRKDNSKPKIILASCGHGEPAAAANTYNVLKLICEQWETSEALEAIRFGVDLIVIPIANPDGYTSGTRKNDNKVDFNRNFEVGWSYNPDSDSHLYGGTKPLSEVETQTLDTVMQTHNDAIAFISHHAMSGTESQTTPDGSVFPNGTFIWIIGNSFFTKNMGQALINRTSVYAKKNYQFVKDSFSGSIGYADYSAIGGSDAAQASKYGIQGSNFETNLWFKDEIGKPALSPAVATVGAVALVNWILINLNYAPRFYADKIVR